MPFKKRKEAKELQTKQRSDDRASVEKQFGALIQKACLITDPAQKIIALRGIETSISSRIQKENNAIAMAAKSKGNNTESAGKGAAYAAGAGLLLFAGPIGWVGIPVMAAGIIGSDIIGSRHKNSIRKKLQLELNDHLGNMEDLTSLVSEITKVTVENNVEAISQSPLYGKVKALPGITAVFAAAAAKHIAETKAATAEEAPPVTETPAVKEEPKNPPKKKPANFDRITKVGKQF